MHYEDTAPRAYEQRIFLATLAYSLHSNISEDAGVDLISQCDPKWVIDIWSVGGRIQQINLHLGHGIMYSVVTCLHCATLVDLPTTALCRSQTYLHLLSIA